MEMDDYRGYPNLTEAAHLLGVSVATLSRQKLNGIRMGGRDIRLSPTEVLAHADFFKRRPLTEVAGELVERAYKVAPEVADNVVAEVDKVLSARPSLRSGTAIHFLAEARRVLPRRLYAQIARYYQESVNPPTSLGPVPSRPLPSPTVAQPPHKVTVKRQLPDRLSHASPGVNALASAESGVLARKA
jgi:hypothetical protein